MLFHDRAIIDGPARITREGHLVAMARVAKANNIQDYRVGTGPGELDIPGRAVGSLFKVFRPESAVFATDSMASAAHRPVTIGHPAEDVSATNWKALSVGDTGGEIREEIVDGGKFLRVPVMVMDAKGVRAATTTHQEFSLGYSADLDLTPGKFGDEDYDAAMRDMRINHLAMVPAARGGTELRIVDERPAHLRDHQEITVKKIMLDGLQVDLSDSAAVEVAFGKLQGQLTDAKTAQTTAEASLATANTTIVARDAEIVTLKKSVEDAKVTPQQMRYAAKAYATTVAKATALGITVTDAMDEPAIKKAVVDKAMGDGAKDYTEADVATAFMVLTKDTKIDDTRVDPLRDALRSIPASITDAQSRRDIAHKNMVLRDQGLPEIKAA